MKFTDAVPNRLEVVVEGCDVSSLVRSGPDKRLGTVALRLMGESGVDITGWTVENLHEHAVVVGVTNREVIVGAWKRKKAPKE